MTAPTRPDRSHYEGSASADGPTMVMPGRRRQHPMPPNLGYPNPQQGWARPAAGMPPQAGPGTASGFGAPVWGPPPGQPAWAGWASPPMRPQRSAGTRWAVFAGVTALITAVGIVAVTAGSDDGPASAQGNTVKLTPTAPVLSSTAPTSTTKATPVAAPVDPAGVLLTPAAVEAVTRVPMVAGGSGSNMVDDSAVIDPASCASAWGPIQSASYAGSGYLESAGQIVKSDTKKSLVLQAAVSYASPDAAAAYVDSAIGSWNGCAQHPVTFTADDGSASVWHFGAVESVAGGAFRVLSQTPEGAGGGWSCERALGTSGAMVIDTLACGTSSAGQAAAIGAQIAENVGSS
jgi:hypothetical protein